MEDFHCSNCWIGNSFYKLDSQTFVFLAFTLGMEFMQNPNYETRKNIIDNMTLYLLQSLIKCLLNKLSSHMWLYDIYTIWKIVHIISICEKSLLCAIRKRNLFSSTWVVPFNLAGCKFKYFKSIWMCSMRCLWMATRLQSES